MRDAKRREDLVLYCNTIYILVSKQPILLPKDNIFQQITVEKEKEKNVYLTLKPPNKNRFFY